MYTCQCVCVCVCVCVCALIFGNISICLPFAQLVQEELSFLSRSQKKHRAWKKLQNICVQTAHKSVFFK